MDSYQELANQVRERIRWIEEHLAATSSTQQKLREEQRDESLRIDILSTAPVDEAVEAQLKRELNDLNKNLKWLESDEAGSCAECGRMIPVERLKVVPTTRSCVNCADH